MRDERAEDCDMPKTGGAEPGSTPGAEAAIAHRRRAAAARALTEAATRRTQEEVKEAMPAEYKGRGGLEPVRYGDWEVRGLASDF
jgi:hypothetical protein